MDAIDRKILPHKLTIRANIIKDRLERLDDANAQTQIKADLVGGLLSQQPPAKLRGSRPILLI